MPLIPSKAAPGSRERVVRALIQQGVLGIALVVGATALRPDEPGAVLRALAPGGATLAVTLVLFATALALLKFPLTSEIFVAPAVTVYIALIPLLGMVMSMWIAVLVAIVARVLAILGVGPTKIVLEDVALERARILSLFCTYGIPVAVGAFAYEALGGVIPIADASLANGARICAAGLVVVATNELVMLRTYVSMGYTPRTMAKMTTLDAALYTIGLPYSVLIPYCWVALGYRGMLPVLFVGLLGTILIRILAAARSSNEDLVRRLASLSNVATAISLKLSRDELLQIIHRECASVVDASYFTVALFDADRRELRFEYEARGELIIPKVTIPLGEGPNSWVIDQRKPLRIGSSHEERERGIFPIDDGLPSESWLGVPMIVQDRILGVMAVQSERRDAFTEDDVVLMNAVASHAAAAIEDSTLYRNMEASNFELERRVADRTTELREANLQLVAADRAKSRFLANTSHELRTPLNAIIGFTNIVHEQTREQIAPRMGGFLENILTSANHLLALINDILDLSKVEAGRMEVHLERFDLRESLASVERVMKGIAVEAGVVLETHVEDSFPMVVLDDGRVRQILINLLSNAVKFSPRGEIVHLATELVPASLSPLGCETVRIRVADQGPGMTKEEAERIFEEFYQIGRGGMARAGTGLGLPLTRRFVELMHGEVRVESRPNEGSVFEVDLPVDATMDNVREFRPRARA